MNKRPSISIDQAIQNTWPEPVTDLPNKLRLIADGRLPVKRGVLTADYHCQILYQAAKELEKLEAYREVRNSTTGLAGWHLNGDVATWDEVIDDPAVEE